jgi:threonine dehydrogenase-like Zn-dependent dehydrogenase
MTKLVKLLTTEGNGKFEEIDWVKPPIKENEIEVKAVMTGICRSDIDMMKGQFSLPLWMHGHEGLGIVTDVGKNVNDVKLGSYVATRGEPAYADYYNAPQGTYVQVPKLEPKYIVEPIACGINVFNEAYNKLQTTGGRICLIGTGFLSHIVYSNFKLHGYTAIDVIGNHSKDFWKNEHNVDVKSDPIDKYRIVIDLSNNNISLTKDIYHNNASLIFASSKHPTVASNFDYLLWNAVTMICPSPRTHGFHNCMKTAVQQIEQGLINVDNFWTRKYDRTTEWQQAFQDSLDRPVGFNRAYLVWPISQN